MVVNFPIVVAIIKYQTFKENLDSEITDQKQKNSFISSAIKCHRDDVLIEKKIIDEHFIQKLEKKFFFCPI